MAKNIQPCPRCTKPLELIDSVNLGAARLNSYKCGHSFTEDVVNALPQTLDYSSVNGDKSGRDYQVKGVDFIYNGVGINDTGFNCILADQMRLGKTPQFLLALMNAFRTGKKKKALILVRGANLWQWIKEYKVWCDSLPLGIYPIIGSKAYIPDGFNAYIMSMDTFSRDGTCKNCKHAMQRHDDTLGKCSSKGCTCRFPESNGDAMTDRLLEFGFDVCCVDEAHSFKNTSSRRSQALLSFLKQINTQDITHDIPFTCMMCRHTWNERVTVNVVITEDVKRVSKTAACPACNAQQSQSSAAHVKVTRKCSTVLLTGTPVKNRADEYFVPLNIVAPHIFPSLEAFRRRWLIQDSKGKWSRVAPYVLEEFQRVIAPYVLRREKEDVYESCPPLNKMFTVITVEDERLKKAYNQVLDILEENMARNPNLTMPQSIGEFALLRRICGLAKVNWVSEYAESMLTDDPKCKLAIGLHHKDVKDALAYQLEQYGVMKFDGSDSAEEKYRKQVDFETCPERILAINMLAGGVGCDFHYINDVLVLERQWNHADEEQFEYRFYNPDKSIKNVPTDIEYVIAKGTLDEWFHDHVEETRRVFGETMGSDYGLGDQSTFKQLLEKTVSHRL